MAPHSISRWVRPTKTNSSGSVISKLIYLPFYGLAVNHTKECIDWEQLPFATKASTKFRIPVPVFAPRVREMEVSKVHKIGSHTFFMARIVSDQTYSAGPVLCAVHGFYQAWRLKGRSVELQTSITENARSKKGTYRPEADSVSSGDANRTHAGAPL